MSIIAHISDLHFGTVKAELAQGLLTSLHEVEPDLVVVSGDLTQRARSRQFHAAKTYLDSLPCPCLVVPGNHDVPLYHVLHRFFQRLAKYQQYISQDLQPSFQTRELAVLGVNTARSLTWKNGRVSVEQMQAAQTYFCNVPNTLVKVLVTHHPFLPPPEQQRKTLVGRAKRVLQTIEQCHLDLLLAGHFHMSYAGGTHVVYTMIDHSILVIQAGTALSSRVRDERNAYNVITTHPNHVVQLSVRMWDDRQFVEVRNERYSRQQGQWQVE
ncbi:metallophosphoesterase [candidate division KSB3 bacterium]|uniref:Metallophosphoesterase n=1 Tax=candidate division KSB3 bacterium TaxID=2044937 RepID=A0A9D5JYQ7_9BACT|nr:metallophosphoesterase [candidate division KSB3 bacterium]MBD3326257.1 metallophosphoesterase [candidate division KSB3 bacterium]